MAAGGSLLAFSQALDEADGCANVVELGAELVFEEALITEVQWLFLVGKDKESGRRDFRLCNIVNTHGAGFWRGAALQVDFILEPIVEDRGGDATAARFPALIDERKKACPRARQSSRKERRSAHSSEISIWRGSFFRSQTSNGQNRSFPVCGVRRERAWICLSPWPHRVRRHRAPQRRRDPTC